MYSDHILDVLYSMLHVATERIANSFHLPLHMGNECRIGECGATAKLEVKG